MGGLIGLLIDWLIDRSLGGMIDWMLIPTQWIKLKAILVYFKPLREVTTLHFIYDHVVYKSTVASLHNQTQFHLYERNTIFFGIVLFWYLYILVFTGFIEEILYL